jgi:hypothetical protein
MKQWRLGMIKEAWGKAGILLRLGSGENARVNRYYRRNWGLFIS